MLCKNVFERLRYELAGLLRKPFVTSANARAEAYLVSEGVLPILQQKDPNELKAVYGDLAYLHKSVRRMKPKTVVEFGVGLSTLVFTHALQANLDDQPEDEPGRLYTVDTSQYWLDNTRQKLTDSANALVELRFSEARLTTVNGELCHVFDQLPNVVPDLIYVDGPDPATVVGEVNGLTHTVERGEPRRAMSADVLLYEAGLKVGARIIVDNRKMNTRFLRRNLRRRWKFSGNKTDGRFTFALMD